VTRLRTKYCLTTLLVLACSSLSAATISLSTKLTPVGSEAASFDRMGQAVAVSGNTAVVGAHLATESGLNDAGTAYVFLRNGASSWTRQQKIAHPNPAANDLFGNAVAISGETMAVAAILDDEVSAANAGAVYIFTRNSNTWTLQQRVIASDPSVDGGFGRSIALDGNTLLVGAHRANSGKGAAYTFTRSGSVWTQQQRLVSSDGLAGDYFGASVAISGDRLVVGAERADAGVGTQNVVADTGAAYAFQRSGAGVWSQQTKLIPATFSQDDNFGISVAISGATIAVGQPFLGTGVSDNKGAVIVFNEESGVWNRKATLLASDAAANDFFGRSVSISGDFLLIGAYFDDFIQSSTSIVNGGSSYLFRRNGTTWTEADKLLGNDTIRNDFMGSAVALSGAAMIIGAPFDGAASLVEAGTAFVHARDDVTLTNVSVSNATPAFGESISITAVVSPSEFDVGTPEGFVQFFSGGLSMGTVQLVGSSNTATLNFTPSLSGNHHITARYNGDSNHLESTSPIRTVTVAQVATSVLLTPPAANSVPYGTSLTYTANLSVAGGAPLPSGTIRFVDGSTNLATVNMVNGVATFSISTLGVGPHNVSAVYLGDANYQPFTTPADAITVTQAAVSIDLTTSPSPSLEGNPISVVATLSGGVPTGLSVGFKMTSPTTVILGSVNTNASGIATINTAGLPAGTYQFEATFFGDINHAAAFDVSGLHSVLAAANLTITKTNNQRYVQSGTNTTYTIVVTNNGPNPVTGATVIDDIDDDLVTGLFEPDAPWTCASSGGASCSGGSSGTGDINLSVDLPVGGIITIEVDAQSRSDAEPFVSNTASVSLPGTMGDPVTTDNVSTDSDPSGVFGDGFEVPSP
jgi:uncharacterized repeat protein (TIGR01451 family)